MRILRVGLFLFCASVYSMEINDYQFEDLMTETSFVWLDLHSEDLENLQFYKSLFFKNRAPLPEIRQKIPKIIHFIWLGQRPFPESSKKNLLSWRKLHPDWIMKFWTDSSEMKTPISGMEPHSVSCIPLSKLGHLITQTSNYGELSDLFRYEILFHEGGIYADHDVECFQSFDSLTREYDFFTYLEAPTRFPMIETRIRMNNGLIGIRAGHPILEEVMKRILSVWDTVQQQYPGTDMSSQVIRTLKRTFVCFTTGVRAKIDQPGNCDIVFPASFGCPIYGFRTPEVVEVLKAKKLSYVRHDHANAWHHTAPLTGMKKILKKANLWISLLFCFLCFSFLFVIRKKGFRFVLQKR